MRGMLTRAAIRVQVRVVCCPRALARARARRSRCAPLANWWRLLVPPRVLDQPRWALVDRRRRASVIKLVIAGDGARGSIDPDRAPLPGVTPKALAAYAKALGVGAVIVDRAPRDPRAVGGDRGRAAARPGSASRRGSSRCARSRSTPAHGMWTEPPLLDLLPAPAFEPIQRTFDLLIPDRSALVAYVIEDDRSRIHTSIIAVKDGGDITRAAHASRDRGPRPRGDARARLGQGLQARARRRRGAVRRSRASRCSSSARR